MEEEKYSIVINDDEIEVYGQVSCSEGMSILSFASNRDYNWLGQEGRDLVLTLRKTCAKNDKKKEKEFSLFKEQLDNIEKKEKELEQREVLSQIVAKKNSELEDTIVKLEKLLKNIVESFQDREDQMMQEMRKYRKAAKIVEMQDSEEVQEILKKFSNDPEPVKDYGIVFGSGAKEAAMQIHENCEDSLHKELGKLLIGSMSAYFHNDLAKSPESVPISEYPTESQKLETSYRKQMQDKIDSMKKYLEDHPEDWYGIFIPYEYGHIYKGFVMVPDLSEPPQAQIIRKLEDYLKETENDPTKSAAPRPNPQGTCYCSSLD